MPMSIQVVASVVLVVLVDELCSIPTMFYDVPEDEKSFHSTTRPKFSTSFYRSLQRQNGGFYSFEAWNECQYM